MIRRAAGATLSITLIGIAALTLWALAARSDGSALGHVSAVTVGLTLVLVAFATVVEMPLEGDGLSLGYGAGLLAILALGQSSDLFSAVAVIGAGGLLGGVIRAVWRDGQDGRALGPHTFEEALYAAVQLILALAVGEVIYVVFGGELPLTGLHMRAIPPLIGLIGSSLIVYGAIYALRLTRLRIDPRRVFADNRYAIGMALGLPISFALAGTLVIPVSLVGFAILATGVLLLAVLSSELGRQRLRYRQQVRELSSLSALNQAMRANLDLSALLETIRLQIASQLEVETIVIALYDPMQEVVQFPVVYRSGRIDRRRARPLDSARPLDYVIQRQAALRLAPDAAANARARGLQPPEVSAPAPAAWMGVPLLASGRTTGALAIAAGERAFTADDQRLLTTIAAQSAISIDNAQLYEQSQTHARQLSQLNEWAARLGATLDPLHVFDLVIEAATDITGADGAALFVCLDDPARTLALTRSNGLSAALRNDPPAPIVLTDNAHTAQALAIGRAATDPRAAPIREQLIAGGFAAWIELTIRDSNPEAPASGALVAYYRQPHRFVPEEIELMRAFANQAAAAIHNAQAYRSTNEALELRIAQLSALASINQELASTL
ncbi:MAG: GAF domain-containing protein, partial [Aggregatilineales bacterium]